MKWTSDPSRLKLGRVLPLSGRSVFNAPLGNILASAPLKRKAFFSFHFDDIMRVNVVRNAWKIDHPDTPQMRSFYDSSLWENRQLESSESVKRLIREGVEHTSAICVLVGSLTWSRRWVRYEGSTGCAWRWLPSSPR